MPLSEKSKVSFGITRTKLWKLITNRSTQIDSKYRKDYEDYEDCGLDETYPSSEGYDRIANVWSDLE